MGINNVITTIGAQQLFLFDESRFYGKLYAGGVEGNAVVNSDEATPCQATSRQARSQTKKNEEKILRLLDARVHLAEKWAIMSIGPSAVRPSVYSSEATDN